MTTKRKVKTATDAKARVAGRARPVPAARTATRRQLLTIAGATAGATTGLAHAEAFAAKAPEKAGARGKQELQTALICIAGWADAVRQVLSADDPKRRIRMEAGIVRPLGGRAGCPPNVLLSGHCWPIPTGLKGSISIKEILGALERIEKVAEAVGSGIDPISPENFAGFTSSPPIADIVTLAKKPGVRP